MATVMTTVTDRAVGHGLGHQPQSRPRPWSWGGHGYYYDLPAVAKVSIALKILSAVLSTEPIGSRNGTRTPNTILSVNPTPSGRSSLPGASCR
jgi:hypothetical protein